MDKETKSKLFQAVDLLVDFAEMATEDIEEREEIGQASDLLINYLKENK